MPDNKEGDNMYTVPEFSRFKDQPLILNIFSTYNSSFKIVGLFLQ